MQIRRRLLDTAQRKRLDRSLRRDHHSAFYARLEKTFDREIVHLVVGVERWLVTNAALRLTEEQVFTANFTLRSSCAIQTSKHVQFWRRRKIEQRLKLRHEMDLRTALQNAHTFFGREHRIAVEIGRTLFKLRKVFNVLQCALRSKKPLNKDTTQRRSLNPSTVLLRSNIADEVKRRRCMTIHVTIKTSDAKHAVRALCFAICGGIELLLRKLRDQQTQAFELFGIQNAIKQVVKIIDRYQLTFRNVAEVFARRQKHRRWKLRQKMIR